MIIDFTVENYLSIKNEQTFSMVAERDKSHLSDNLFAYSDKISILKTAAIFGPNGSGKTNLIFALDNLIDMVVKSSSYEEGDSIPCYLPYELSEDTINSPTKFDLEFIVGNKRYSYQIQFDEYQIVYEALFYYPSVKPAKIFERTSSSDWNSEDGISFGSYYKGGKRRHAYFPNNSYLSKAGRNPESPKFIRDVYNYFRKDMRVRLSEAPPAVLGWDEDPIARSTMKCLMTNLGLGIVDFKIEHGDLDPKHEKAIADFPKPMQEAVKREMSKTIKYGHLTETGEMHYISDEYESLGTRKLFDYLPTILLTLRNGEVLVVDEVSTNFHSHVLELLVKLFNDPKVNVNNAQLIFTTHDLMIMRSNALRKDQIYLAEKTNGMTEYTSLDEFDSSLRNNSPFEKWYYEGRLGAVPSLEYSEISENVSALIKGAETNA
ncbi:AAA family ATPase [Vibrio coralliilyticus]|uniref:AAA family ATPase n=1 Tax=Vibrio coralliilyticus TaxID=190893 RepID=UPI0017A1FA6B|nr:ATP-binding protein [Vibrio coralliilyticus]NUW69557.1 ATP-binding protein [Vibrio coralliilyticus]